MSKNKTTSSGNDVKLIKLGSTRPASSLDKFKQIRAETDRAKVLKLMNGTKSADQIAVTLGGGKFTARYVMAHAYCTHRDCGIGYRLTDTGKLLAVYPVERTYRDAIIRKKKNSGHKKPVEVTVSA